MSITKRNLLLGLILLGTIASARADVIKGRVVDNANHPIPNAEVRVPFQGTGTKAQQMLGTFLHTDAQGFFSADFAPMKNGGYGVIYAAAPGFAEGRLRLKSDVKGKTNVIHLQKAEVISGVVVDPQGKPAAGVEVQLEGFTDKSTSDPNFNPTYWLGYSPWADRYQTVTDKTGHWQFKAVPQDSYAQMIIHDPRFVSQEFDVYPGKQYLLHARPGAMLSGRVVNETGAPVANVKVTAQEIVRVMGQDEGHATSTTATDGSYRLTGLSTGFYTVSADAGELPLVAAIIKDKAVIEGGTEKIRNLVLTPGGIITGRVLNEKTGAPGENTFVNSSTSRDPQSLADVIWARTDANGYYTLRVPPGTRYVSAVGAEEEYTHKNNDVVILKILKGQTNTQNFELNSGETLSGVAVDQQGKPVAGVQILVYPLSVTNSSEIPGSGGATSDANGRWKVAAQVPGPVNISALNPWYISNPTLITLPHPGEVKIIVNNINDLRPVGRVVDIHHKPLTNVRVLLMYTDDSGSRSQSAEAVSDNNGYLHGQPVQFDSPNNQFSANVYMINDPKYIFVRGGFWNAKSGTISDIVLDRLDNKVQGRVLNEQGKPAPGVRVEAAGFDNAVTKTDKMGNFKLSGLPHQNVTLLAIGKQTVGKLTLPSGSWAILHLAPLPANHFPSRAQILDRLEKICRTADKKDFMRSRYVDKMIECDAPRGLKVLSDVNGKLSSQLIYNAINALSENNPSLALKWGGQHLAGITKDDDRIKVLCQLTKLAVGRDDDLAQKYFSEAEILAQKIPAPVQKIYIPYHNKDKSMDQFLSSRIQLAGAAAKIHPGKTNKWLMQLLDYSMDKDLKPPANFDYIRGEMAADLGTFAPQQAALLIQNSSPISAATELYFATAAVAHADKPDLALHWLDQLRAMYQSENASDGNDDLGDVTSAVIQLIGPKNPAKALELARMIIDKQESARCLMLAATYQSKPIALAVLNEISKSSPQTNYVNSLHLAAMIYNLDPRRGKVLFDELLKKYQQQRKEFFNSGRNISALDESLAYYMARYKLTVSWEILQNAHAKSKQQPPQDNFYNRNYSQIPLAMSALNFDEAMRWARELPPQTNPLNNSNNSANTQFRLLQIALATPQARRTLDFDNPNAFNS